VLGRVVVDPVAKALTHSSSSRSREAAVALESGGSAVIVGAANGSAGPEAVRPARSAPNPKRAIVGDRMAAVGYPGGANRRVRAQKEATHEAAAAW
jgi:hypothetical protein